MNQKAAIKKTSPATSSAPAPAPASAARDPFAEYKDADEFVQPEGYWDPEEGPLHGTLESAFEYRQKSGRGKGQLRVIFLFRLLQSCKARVVTEGGADYQTLVTGDLCAVYDSAGLRALRDLWKCRVLITRRPEQKQLDNGNAMWIFDVKFRGQRQPLPVRKAFEKKATSADDYDAPDDDGAEPF